MDGDTLLNLALVILFVLIGGIFAGTEMAIVTLREGQTAQIERSGPRGRRTAELVRNPNRFLAAVQIGVTVAGFFSSAYGAATLAPDIAPVLMGWGIPAGAASTAAVVGMTLVIAYLSLVLGELVPKRLAMQRSVGFTRVLAPPLNVFAALMRPVIWLLSVSTNTIVRLLGGDPKATAEEVSPEELRQMLVQNRSLNTEHRRILTDTFGAGDRLIREVMRPRTDVVFLDGHLTVDEARETVRALPHTRYPVLGRSIDDVVGFVHIRDLFDAPQGGGAAIAHLTRPLLALPTTKRFPAALARMRQEGHQIALVVDEYGGTDGIVTMEDLIEELVGEIYDEYDGDAGLGAEQGPEAAALAPGESLEIDAGLILEDMPGTIGLELPDDGPYETIAGFVIDRLGHLPRVGDTLDYAGHRFEALTIDSYRLERLRITRLEP